MSSETIIVHDVCRCTVFTAAKNVGYFFRKKYICVARMANNRSNQIEN